MLVTEPTLQGPWELKMRAMTQRVYIDDIEAEEDAVTGSIDCQAFFFVHFFSSPIFVLALRWKILAVIDKV